VDEEAYHHAGGGQLYKSFSIGPEGCGVIATGLAPGVSIGHG
jgi:hypothetical protein